MTAPAHTTVSSGAAAPAGDDGFGTFFLPGPTEVRPEVLRAMVRPMMPHRGKAFEALFARIQDGLRAVFKTARPVLVSSSSATGLMEMAVRCSPPGPVLALVNGAFSERFAEIARACGRETTVLDTAWGRAPDPGDLARALGARRYAAVTVVHSETSTGVLTDVRGVSDAAHAHGAMCLVDSVTGVGGAALAFDEGGFDFALTGSQKALALPPGLAFGVASADYVRRAADAPARGRYFDVVEFEQYAQRNQTPNTPALPLLYALDAQLARVAAETVEGRWARHQAMAARTATWADAARARHGDAVGVLARPGERSPTVSAITLPDRVAGAQVVQAVASRGITIGGGYGKLRDRTFRVGHMGDHTPAGLARCLAACDDALATLLGS
jgi:predicted phosphoserine aminotransferase